MKASEIKIGTGVTENGWTDRYPYEVVRIVSEKCLEIRAMDAKLDPAWKPEWHVGGFAGHCSNQHEQKWNLTSNPENPTKLIRLTKKGWSLKSSRYDIGVARKFHDYNF